MDFIIIKEVFLIIKVKLQFPSSNGVNQIFASCWKPEIEPIAVLQISHGMAEFIDRYTDFAEFLTSHGFLVVGNDHLGHGRSVAASSDFGYFSKKNSKDYVIEDIYTLHQLVKQDYPTLPYFLMGHSMGSFIVRNYLQKYGASVDGAIIMGTSGPKLETALILPILEVLNKLQPRKQNKWVDQLAFGSFNNYFPEDAAEFAWLSENQENVQRYMNHPQTGFIFTNNGFLTLFTLLQDATKPGWAKPISRELPLLIISGEDDPVGQMGVGIRKVFRELEELDFVDVTFCSYPTMRHEILMETNHLLVYSDILDWLSKHL
ncbi:alpha/beta fold hydrolase [Carnobacterium maltaromaticum]|uniref:alpha/beta fold hydrolase n=1 Tax=Carnobacterium maltaromaticum TaxID=2751 RepID=UPI002D785FDD|nr:alpha/beta fold hydrolase [Carnobacterium maltaromaticum]